MKLNWEDYIGRVYVGDCMEFMREMPDGCVDAVITDPPYPNLKGNLKFTRHGRQRPTVTVGDLWGAAGIDWCVEVRRLIKYGAIVFCTHQGLSTIEESINLKAKALLVWYKINAMFTLRNVPRYDTEFIWCFHKASGLQWRKLRTTLFDIPKLNAGGCASERIVDSTTKAVHPTQKPLKLMLELVRIVPSGGLIFDPFAGLGTTLVAAQASGLKFIGCEINPEYAAIAEQRIAREREKLQLPFEEPIEVEQLSL